MSVSLRYDIDKLSKDILMELKGGLKQLTPDFFVSAYHEKYQSQKLILLKHNEPFTNIYDETICRIKIKNGYAIYVYKNSAEPKYLILNKGNLKYIKDGAYYRVTKKKSLIFSLYINDNGVVKYQRNNSFKTLSLSNIQSLSFAKKYIIKLLSLKPNLEWFENLLKVPDQILPGNNHPIVNRTSIGNNLWNGCNSAQEFIDSCNLRNRRLPEKWFEGMSIYDIVNIMRLPHDPTRYFSNAKEYLNYVGQTGTDFTGNDIIWGATRTRRIIWTRSNFEGLALDDTPIWSRPISVMETDQ